jgi:hypothetical protein
LTFFRLLVIVLSIPAEFLQYSVPLAFPLKPSLSLHWLAVNGVQPAISENPSFTESEPDGQRLQLPKELQVGLSSVIFTLFLFLYLLVFFSRITGIIVNATNFTFLHKGTTQVDINLN